MLKPALMRGSARQVIRRARVLAAIGVVATLAGCLASPTVIGTGSAPAPGHLDGILTHAKSDANIRIFLTHGIGTAAQDDGTGTNGPCALASVIVRLAYVLGVQQQPVDQPRGACGALVLPPPRDIVVSGASRPAELYDFAFTGARTVTFSFLLWAPITEDIKATLGETGHPPWALLTTAAKSFFQSHLSDVVLYGGTYRAVMRAAVEQALCLFVGGTPADDPTICRNAARARQTVLITHSLGGYMLMDAIADIRAAHASPRADGRPPAPADTDAAAIALERTDLIFMLANQLALLDLTTLTTFPIPPGEAAGEGGRMLDGFRRHWDRHHQRVDDRRRQIVAVSDPNDLLSYLVSSGDVTGTPPHDPTVVANVYLGVARNWLDLFAWPVSAHVNYLTSRDVMDIMGCGMTGDAINACPP